MTKYLLMTVGLMLSPLVVEVASANDFQIAVQRKKAAHQHLKAKSRMGDAKGSETAYYQVTVTNRAFNKPSEELEARYVLFVERQKLGQKVGTEETERVRGDTKIAALKAQGKATFDTSEVVLEESGLSGAYSGFENGGRTRAKDSIQGIWVKLYEGGVEVGEYVNPTTLKNKMKWE